MAYDPRLYYPQNYNFQMPPPQMYQQPQQQTSMIWVSGEREAQSYPVAPNNAVALWDSNGSTIYLKQTDASGKPSIKAYDLKERASSGVSSSPATDIQYAEKSEIDALSSAIDALKGDVLKIKKAMKRKEADEDDE